MSMEKRIINVGDELYLVKGRQTASSVESQGMDYWKRCWGVDHVLRNGDIFYFCDLVIEAEYEDI